MSYIPDDAAENHVYYTEDDPSIQFEKYIVESVKKVDSLPKGLERKELMEEIAVAIYDRLYFY